MQIRRLVLKNFRSVASGEVLFNEHTVLIGSNSVGKSTVCEALDLLLGPDRLSRTNAINEHNFHQRKYLDDDGEPVKIELEVVLTDLTPEVEANYRAHREYWDIRDETLLDEEDNPEDTDLDHVKPAFRITFEGVYDKEEDEFSAQTYLASPPADDGGRPVRVSRSSKREFGFIYLRVLRTGARALSLARGSLLDIIIRLKEDDRSEMWEQTLGQLEDLKPRIDEIPQLKDILEDIDERARRFIALTDDGQAFRLFASSLTREDLRRSITLFGSSKRSTLVVPSMVEAGVPPMAAHMFAFYFGILSMITPPVAAAAFAAASIAGSDFIRTGFSAAGSGRPAHLVPFIFALSPEMLWQGTWFEIARIFVLSVAGVWLISAGWIAYMGGLLSTGWRVLFVAAGVMCLIPGGVVPYGRYIDLVGLVMGLALLTERNLPIKARAQNA